MLDNRPMFNTVSRVAVQGEWVQCKYTRDVWEAKYVNDDGDVIVGQYRHSPTGEMDVIFLDEGCYYVFEQSRRDEPEIIEDW